MTVCACPTRWFHTVALLLALMVARWCGAGCTDVGTFEDGLTPAALLHVAEDGSDATGDGTEANPFATISHAAGLAEPGTAVVVHEGVYVGGGYVADAGGTEEAPVWIGGAAGEAKPVISGGGTGLHFVRPKYLVLHDIEVTGASDNGINCDDGGDYDNPLAAHHLVIRDSFVHGMGSSGNQDGIKLSGINLFALLDCEVTDAGGGGSGVDLVGCHHGVIARCDFHDLGANAIQCKGGTYDVEIKWCRLRETGGRSINIGGSTGLQYFRPPLSTTEPNAEASDVRVAGNIIEGADASVAFVGCVDCVVADNTLVTPHNWLFRILQETISSGDYEFLPCGNNTFANNIVYFSRADLSTYINIGPNTAAETFTFAHNLWFAYDDEDASQPSLPAEEVGGIYGEDPLLASPNEGDYRIGVESPAAGVGLTPTRLNADKDGTPFRNPPSIGAFETPPAEDIGGDGKVDTLDLLEVLGAWGPCLPLWPCPGDLDCSGMVDVTDLLAVLGAWDTAG